MEKPRVFTLERETLVRPISDRVAADLAILIALVTIVSKVPLYIASAQTQPTFEVVSVKVHRDRGGTTREISPDGIRYLNITLGEFINMAHGGKRYQLAGPDWAINNASSDRYDIVAKAPEVLQPDQIRQMIGPVLADRFKLTFHREKRDLPVFILKVATGGPKFKAGDGGYLSAYPDGTGAVSYKNYTMDALANLLSNMPTVGRAVVDQTGLGGRYTFTANLLNMPSGLTVGEQKKAEFDADPSSTPIFTTLQEQLGLRLEAQKAPIEMIVIDHVDKVPSEN